jgi:hypothetical protein
MGTPPRAQARGWNGHKPGLCSFLAKPGFNPWRLVGGAVAAEIRRAYVAAPESGTSTRSSQRQLARPSLRARHDRRGRAHAGQVPHDVVE